MENIFDDDPNAFDELEKRLKNNQKLIDKEKIKIHQTSSYKKILNCINELNKNLSFKKDITKLRDKFDIPKNGYIKLIYKKDNFNKRKILTYPKYNEFVSNQEYKEELINLSKKYKTGIFWEDILESYIFYNKFLIEKIEMEGGMLITEDIYAHFNGNFGLFKDKDWYVENNLKRKSKEFPIAILLNPYVSQNDITNYIKKIFKVSIEPKLKWYRENNIKLGVIRKKSDRVEQRNKFIYEHRNMKIKDLVSLTNKEFKENMDYTYVSKILKKERNLRK